MMNNQNDAFNKLSKLKVGALFMEMGTGKTKVAIDLIDSKKHKISYVLWICPFSLKGEIERERNKWHPDMPLHIIGCESIGSSDRIYLDLMNRVSNNDTFIVVDESLKIKNKDAKRTKRIIQLGEKAKYKLILNGTPLSRNVLDLYTQMEFLSPKILNMSYNQFKDTYTEYYVRGRLKGLVKKQHNIEHLISKIDPYIFDCDLDIDYKKNYHDYYYSMNCEEKEQYEKIKNDYIDSDDEDQIDFYSMISMLQNFYCQCEDKSNTLNELINTINDKVIVFCKYLKSIGDNHIVGDMNIKERMKVIDDFKNDKFKVLYITYGCGSYGLNLQFCNNIIFSEHTFDYSQKIQAEARIYRIGQDKDVNYYNLWCRSGLEDMIFNSLTKKTKLLNEVKIEISKKGIKEWLKSM